LHHLTLVCLIGILALTLFWLDFHQTRSKATNSPETERAAGSFGVRSSLLSYDSCHPNISFDMTSSAPLSTLTYFIAIKSTATHSRSDGAGSAQSRSERERENNIKILAQHQLSFSHSDCRALSFCSILFCERWLHSRFAARALCVTV